TNTLEKLLDQVLAPYRGEGGNRLLISGDHFAIDDSSATPLALVFHELATNSVKYGALGGNSGQVTLSYGTGSCAESMQLVWTERGGPRVTPPVTKGFGYRLIELSVTNQLGGEIDFDWQPGGLTVKLNLPRQSLMRE
ncbi:MAG: sensor histidine kinase, partial [Novosphingobium sp.]